MKVQSRKAFGAGFRSRTASGEAPPSWAGSFTFKTLKFSSAVIVGVLLSLPFVNAFEARIIGVTARIMPPSCVDSHLAGNVSTCVDCPQDEKWNQDKGDCEQEGENDGEHGEPDIQPKVLGAATPASTSTPTTTLESLPDTSGDSTTTLENSTSTEISTSTPPSDVGNSGGGNNDSSAANSSVSDFNASSTEQSPPPKPDEQSQTQQSGQGQPSGQSDARPVVESQSAPTSTPAEQLPAGN